MIKERTQGPLAPKTWPNHRQQQSGPNQRQRCLTWAMTIPESQTLKFHVVKSPPPKSQPANPRPLMLNVPIIVVNCMQNVVNMRVVQEGVFR